jgi:putative hydrolase
MLPVDLHTHTLFSLCGIHHNVSTGLGPDAYTDRLLAAIERNPEVDVLTHLNDPSYPVHFEAVARAALATGAAVEINTSKTAVQRCPDAITRELVRVVREVGCRVVVTSDTHALDELGRDDSVRPFLEEAAFPAERVVSASAEQAFAFLEERRRFKV